MFRLKHKVSADGTQTFCVLILAENDTKVFHNRGKNIENGTHKYA